jgi:hypothetical protein
MNGPKAEEIRYWEQHIAFWDRYARDNPDNPDANDTANLLGDIVKKIERRI